MGAVNRSISDKMAYLLRLSALLLLFIFVANIDKTSAALGRFRNGRYDDGFLGEPSKFESVRHKPAPEDKWFEQKLDHFGEKNKDVTWKQRYFVNDEFYRNDSTAPIFLMIGGEGEASKRWMSEGAWIKYAEQFGALCFQLEHRFYGKSHPTNDLSTKNLAYLTSEQALADLSNFVQSMKQEYNLGANQKWIAFGGSYPGSLAAWSREKYPELIHGAVSSSGPLLAKVDFKEYFEVVKASLATYSPACLEAVGRAFAQVEILTRHMIGQRNLDEKFKTCTPIKDSIDNPLDMSNFFEALAGNFAGVVQYNKDNRPSATYTIDDLCNVMVNTTIGPPVTRLGVVNDMLLQDAKEKCLDYKYDKMIAELKETAWGAKACNGSRQWTYQTCNEFGFYQTSDNESDTFGDRFAVDFFIKQCMDIYSESMDAKYLQQVVSQTNKYYGALKPNTTNVLYVHGSIDPWHALGLTKSKNPKQPTIYIEGTAHCANMYEPAKTDPPQLVEARNKIIKYLAQLLENFSMERA
ncbi:PREDICTED: putative serine protease K12H4.7 [Rhagoletis zephyria]|uniref:putative serine protease K12H4.7 n=1 Tax=Rhagoletis zephyria TaxID=28612 RepID=UPI00081164BD|nr:PREDICTED: putative serine protease K12H4.7 [Rhagoletis zephyria]XP_017470593.1 PREDICTED: putative serine protease K12H4.7 [Rhagoletis zephyria]XP_017470594.1 PREDICTED: putative serine protease K12H4.7 [Rhagoletis zephyria]XP_017470595.1 PREDICTED: putative serine protease K12H4.7 [Rhagoletis zephyria]